MITNIEYSSAYEGFFASDEKTTADLLALVRAKVEEIDSIEKLEEIKTEIEAETVEYNNLLNEISSAINDNKAGNISTDDMLAVVVPAVKELKENCKALQLVGDDNFDDEEEITTEEVAALKEILVGTKVIVEERIRTLNNDEGSDLAGIGKNVIHSDDSLESFGFDDFDF